MSHQLDNLGSNLAESIVFSFFFFSKLDIIKMMYFFFFSLRSSICQKSFNFPSLVVQSSTLI